jgi:hypothetical protein
MAPGVELLQELWSWRTFYAAGLPTELVLQFSVIKSPLVISKVLFQIYTPREKGGG